MTKLHTYSVFLITLLMLFSGSVQAQQNNFTKSLGINNQDNKWDRNRVNATLVDTLGKIYQGQILYIEPTSIYFLNTQTQYNLENHKDSITHFGINNIEQLHLYRKGQLLRSLKHGAIAAGVGTLALGFLTEESAWGRGWNLFGAAIWSVPSSLITGAIVGTGKKINVRYTREDFVHAPTSIQKLRKYATFKEIAPHHILKTTPTVSHANSNSNIDIPKTRINKPDSPFYISRFHFFINMGLSFPYQKGQTKSEFSILDFSNSWHGMYRETTFINYGFLYRIAKNYRVGFDYSPKTYFEFIDQQKPLTNGYSAASSISFSSFSFSTKAQYVLKPVNNSFTSKWEFVFGTGLAFNSFFLDNSLSIIKADKFSTSSYETEHQNISIGKTGVVFDFEIDYYLTRNCSFFIESNLKMFGTIELPEIEVYSSYLNMSYALPPMNLNPSTIDFSFGIHVHF